MVIGSSQRKTLAFSVNATEVAGVRACRLHVLHPSATNGNRSTESAVDTDVSQTPAASLGSTYHLPIAFALFCLIVH